MRWRIRKQERDSLISNKQYRKYLLEKDFREFCKYYFSDNFYYPYSEYHKEYAWCLWSLKSILFIWHRESAKTTIARRFLVWLICYKKSPFILRSSYDLTKAKENIYYISQILVENTKIVKDFWHLYAWWVSRTTTEARKKVKTLSSFISENGVLLRAMSLSSGTRWLVHSMDGINHRPQTVIFDDIDTSLSVRNPKVIESNYHFLKTEVLWWLSASSQRVVIGNVISQDWLIPRLEKDYRDSWCYFRVPTINNKKGATIVNGKVRDNVGMTNWDRFVETEEESETKNEEFQRKTWLSVSPFVSLAFLREDLWPTSYGQNHLLVPYVDGTTIVKESMIIRKDSVERHPLECHTTLGIDPAFSEKTNTDPVGMTITKKINIEGKTHRFVMYSTELRGKEKELWSIVQKAKELKDAIGFDDIEIEGNNGGEIIGKELRAEWFAVNIQSSTKDKVTRLREHETDFDSGRVYFTPQTKALVDQLILFPNSQNDDMVDSMVFSFKTSFDTKWINRARARMSWNASWYWLQSSIWGRF